MLPNDPVVADSDYRAGVSLGQQISKLIGKDGEFDFKAAWSLAAEAGLFELLIPAGNFEASRAVARLEGLGRACDALGLLLAIGAHAFGVGAPLSAYAGPAHGRTLDALRSGTRIGSLAASEAEAGSDLMSLQTRYRQLGDTFVLDGGKTYIVNAPVADHFIVLATKDARLSHRGISAFLVERDTPGLRVDRLDPPAGFVGCPVGSVMLENVAIPLDARLGGEFQGAKLFATAMLWERSLIAAALLGILRKTIESDIEYCRARSQFRQPIANFGPVYGRIVDSYAGYLSTGALVRETAERLRNGEMPAALACATKLAASEQLLASTVNAARNRGAAGLLTGGWRPDHLWNAIAGTTYSGTSDIQRLIIAGELGLLDP
jgi:alkylation response protein AidB-like acyl-CoA dehydrogenase